MLTLSERDHIQIALQVQLRKPLGSWQSGEPRQLDIRTARLILAELADGRPWIARYFEQRTERAFERIARAALREVEKEKKVWALIEAGATPDAVDAAAGLKRSKP